MTDRCFLTILLAILLAGACAIGVGVHRLHVQMRTWSLSAAPVPGERP